ncbi:MAG: hypothetical protein Q4B28_00830 [bacterium]|nr:hypothetical protein [bacterium]
MLLYGKPLAEQVKLELKTQIPQLFDPQSKYIAILFFGDNRSSAVYVKHKQNYAKDI